MICYLCMLGHPDDYRPVLWRFDCRAASPRQSVYSCADHYAPIYHAASNPTIWRAVDEGAS